MNLSSNLLLASLLFFVCSILSTLNNVALANNTSFLPTLVTSHVEHDFVYLLDQRQHTLGKRTLHQYRVWAVAKSDGNAKLVSRLGTRTLPKIQNILGMGWDQLRQRLIFSDISMRQIFALDPLTNKRNIIANDQTGAGPALGRLGDFVINPSNNTIIAIDQHQINADQYRWLTEISLETGDRKTILLRPASLPHAKPITAITFDPNTNQVFISYPGGVIAHHLQTKEAFILSDSNLPIGQGNALTYSRSIAFDYSNHRLVAPQPFAQQLMAVQVATGERNQITYNTADQNLALCQPSAIWIEEQTAWIADQGHQKWLQFDLSAQTIQTFARTTSGSKPACQTPLRKEVDTLSAIVRDQLDGTNYNEPIALSPQAPKFIPNPISLREIFSLSAKEFWIFAFIAGLLGFFILPFFGILTVIDTVLTRFGGYEPFDVSPDLLILFAFLFTPFFYLSMMASSVLASVLSMLFIPLAALVGIVFP